MRTGLVFCICTLVLLGPGVARGQQPDQDPIGQSFFPPELVIQHQEAIGLSAEQKDAFKAEIRQAQLKFTELQWKLQDEMEKMVSLIKQPHVDEQQVLAQLDKVLAAEREVKREQITLLVRIKNKLTPEQQSKLAELRGKAASK
ncbi:MAG TPA: periplasmic heavy metal sensor [Candidatus Acidoferrum sp.]